MIKRILFVFVCVGMFLNQAGRLDFQNDISLTVLDTTVAIYVFYGVLAKYKELKKIVLKLPKAVLFFLLVVFVSLIFNFRNYTIFQNVVAVLYLIRFLTYLLVFFVTTLLFKNSKEKSFVLLSLTLTGLSLVLAGFIQYIFYSNLRNLYYAGWDDHLYRLFSSFFDPNFAGAYFTLLFTFLLGIWFIYKSKVNNYFRVMILFFLLITLFAIFLTFSRSALVMLLVSVFLFFIFTMRKRYIFIVLGCLVLMLIIVAPKQNIENTDYFRVASVEARFAAIDNVVYVIQRNILLGVGFDAYRYAQHNYGLIKHSSQASIISHANAGTDNSLLFVWATTGIFGFASFIYIIFLILKNSYKSARQNIFSAVFFASFAGVIIDSMFINSLFYPSIILWLSSVAFFVFRD